MADWVGMSSLRFSLTNDDTDDVFVLLSRKGPKVGRERRRD